MRFRGIKAGSDFADLLMEFDIRLVAPLATTIGIMVSIYLWILNQKKKRLSFKVLSCEPILKLSGYARRHLQVRFDGQIVDDASVVLLRLTNSGHLPINVSDYISEISICFNPGALVLMADIRATAPADLDERTEARGSLGLIKTLEDRRVVLERVLLNDGDSMTLQVVVRNHSGRLQVKGHINGISKIEEEKKYLLTPRLLTTGGVTIMIASMFLCEPSSFFYWGFEDILPYVQLFAMGLLLLLVGWRWPRPIDLV